MTLPGLPALDRWRRRVREQEERFAREREKSRNLTDSEMQRWRDYFHGLLTQEREAELLSGEREFWREVVAAALAEVRHAIEEDNRRALEKALAGLDLRIDALRHELTRRAAIDGGQVIELPNPLRHNDAA